MRHTKTPLSREEFDIAFKLLRTNQERRRRILLCRNVSIALILGWLSFVTAMAAQTGMEPTITAIYPVLRDGGLLGAMVLLLIGGMRGWYVWRWQYLELQRERDEWKTLAMRGLVMSSKAVDVVSKGQSS